ncbi:MAG: SDR family NAD(P)-dependent oxidoreductase [Acidobacteriota bacterium]
MPADSRVLAERVFTPADLAAFAELSGDYNPLHVDPVAARRTHFGDCIVHGVFLLAWALESLEQATARHTAWASVSVRFLRPVVVGTAVSVGAEESHDGRVTLTLTASGRTAMRCDVTFAAAVAASTAMVRATLPPREPPAAIPLESWTDDEHRLELCWSAPHGRCLFPALTTFQSDSALAAMLATTRIVGMKIPGRDSVFLQLDLMFTPGAEADEAVTYRLMKYQKSTQRIAVAVSSAAGHGTLWALARPAPTSQAAMEEVKRSVRPGCFAGRHVLVVGGSRGLGELTAKILAAGGATVTLTYRLGEDDAARVVGDIRKHGGSADAFQFDIESDSRDRMLSEHASGADHVCYFATPPILDGDGETMSGPLFERYARVYVSGLIHLAQWLAGQTSGQFFLFNASSVYVETPPIRQLEYAAAKASSEACCRWLKVAHPRATIHVARLPRLLTDQTASFLSSNEHDNLSTVLAELSSWLSA